MTLHYKYWLGILVALLIGTLTVNWHAVPDLPGLLSFGLSLASLVLAVIAIFQTLFSTNSIVTVQQAIAKASSQLEAGAREIDQARTVLSEHLESIPAALGEVSTRVQTLEEKVINATRTDIDAAGLQPLGGDTKPPSQEGRAPKRDEPQVWPSTIGISYAYYMCLRAHQAHKPFVVGEIISSAPTANYVNGAIATFRHLGRMDIELKDNVFFVLDIGAVDADAILDAMAKRYADPDRAPILSAIDEYFGVELPSPPQKGAE